MELFIDLSIPINKTKSKIYLGLVYDGVVNVLIILKPAHKF